MLQFFCILVGGLLIFAAIGMKSLGCGLFGALFIAFAVYKGYKASKEKAEIKANGGKSNKKVAEFKGVCYYGLSDGQADCHVTMYQQNIIFKVNQHESNLRTDKITSAVVKKSSELTGASTGSIVAGGVLFGALCASCHNNSYRQRI